MRLLATMVQGGRGGIHRYVHELARRLAVRPDIELSIDHLAHEAELFAGLGGARQAAPGWDRGGLRDLLRAHVQVRAPAGGLLHVPSYRRVPWLMGGPCVATVHDLAALHQPEKYGWLRHQFLRRAVPPALRRCAAIITPTRHTADDLVMQLGLPAELITVIPNGIDHAVLRPGDRHEALARVQAWQPQIARDFVLYLARVEHPGKGHTALLDAWAQLAATRRDLPQLVFAGALVERHAEVLAHARSLGLSPLCTGHVPEALLADLYRACLLKVFPSRYEGFGLPPVEAMSCGAPVASSRAAALAETAGPAAVLDPDCPESMAAVIAHLLDDSAARAALAAAGPPWAARFDWDATTEQTVAVYHRVAN